jgi:chromate reductase
MNILAISGSLRKQSFNSALLDAVKARAPEGIAIDIMHLDRVPLYNQDLEAEYPARI